MSKKLKKKVCVLKYIYIYINYIEKFCFPYPQASSGSLDHNFPKGVVGRILKEAEKLNEVCIRNIFYDCIQL